MTGDDPIERYVSTAAASAAQLDPPIAIVGHSGAGAFLPAIGLQAGDRPCLVFVDAVVPPTRGTHGTSEKMRALLDRHSEGGLLRKWIDWWPPEVTAQLLPDPDDRETLAADMPQVARSFYERDVPVPDHWSESPCAYLRLSRAYDEDLRQAVFLRWPVAQLDATHLSTHTEPDLVLDTILDLVDRLLNSD